MALFVAGLLAAFYLTAQSITGTGVGVTKNLMMEEVQGRIKALTHAQAQALGDLAAGLPDEGAKIELIAKAVDHVRFESDGSGYFFVYKGTVNAAHPTQKQLIGKDLGETKDANGMVYVRQLFEAAQKGGGFVSFVFDQPGKGQQPKLGYAEAIPNTPYWIGTGIYIDNVAAAEAKITATLNSMTNTRVGITLGVAAALLLFAVLPLCMALGASIVRPLRQAIAAAQEIAGGSLNVRIEVAGKDEIAALQGDLSRMVDTLRANMESITAKEAESHEQAQAALEEAKRADALAHEAQASQQGMVAAAAKLEIVVRELAQASEGLSQLSGNITTGADDQMARVAETATAMEEMNATVLEVARNAGQAAEQTDASRGKAHEGEQAVRATVEAMRTLRAMSEELRANMQRLGDQSVAIGQVMGVINDIADQTNLLALNAAIEAARAGDAGRGFAVVADEVRKLAEKTMHATKEVGETIQGIQTLTSTNVDSMDNAMQAMQQAEDRSTESGQRLAEIMTMADRAAGQVASIATAAEEQSAASEEITRSLGRIDSVAKDNNALAQQASQAITGLAGQTVALRQLIGELQKKAV